jgi:hypothetical protein
MQPMQRLVDAFLVLFPKRTHLPVVVVPLRTCSRGAEVTLKQKGDIAVRGGGE